MLGQLGGGGAVGWRVVRGNGSQIAIYIIWMHNKTMFTVIETPIFQKQADKVWTPTERHAFIDWIAQHPTVGDVIPGADGARKVRWALQGKGKRGGVRVIYVTRNAEDEVVLLTLYAKSKTDNLTGPKLKEIRRALEE